MKTFQLIRMWFTFRQFFEVPFYRLMGKKIVHFIHIPKTGGTSLKIAFMSFGRKTKSHYICLHGHGYRISDIPRKDMGIVIVRDEADRLQSAYRQRKWKAENYGKIKRTLIGITPLDDIEIANGYTSAYIPQEWYFSGGEDRIVYRMNTEALDEQFPILKQCLGIPPWVKLGHYNKRKDSVCSK